MWLTVLRRLLAAVLYESGKPLVTGKCHSRRDLKLMKSSHHFLSRHSASFSRSPWLGWIMEM
jgi:hypothetical protein